MVLKPFYAVWRAALMISQSPDQRLTIINTRLEHNLYVIRCQYYTQVLHCIWQLCTATVRQISQNVRLGAPYTSVHIATKIRELLYISSHVVNCAAFFRFQTHIWAIKSCSRAAYALSSCGEKFLVSGKWLLYRFLTIFSWYNAIVIAIFFTNGAFVESVAINLSILI